MLQTQRIHALGIPNLLHRLAANVADHQLAAPIQETGADKAVGVHRIAVENVRAGIRVPDVLLVDAFANLDAGVFFDVEFRPAWSKILDENAVAMIAEGVKE
jgi:hypothetical protein